MGKYFLEVCIKQREPQVAQDYGTPEPIYFLARMRLYG